jgi:hypothetical protein
MEDYAKSVAQLQTEHPQLTEEIAGFGSLESVLRWMDRRGIALDKIDIIFQDEFSHDFLLPMDEDGLHLAFGIT